MLYIKTRRYSSDLGDGDVDNLFRFKNKAEWFDDPNVDTLVRAIDGNEVLAPGVYSSPVLGIVGPDRLSGGTKGLIMLLKMDEYEPWVGIFGDNCIEHLINISKKKDITIVSDMGISGLPEVFDATFVQTGVVTHDRYTFERQLLSGIAHLYVGGIYAGKL